MFFESIRRHSNLWHRQLYQLSDNRRQPGVDFHPDRYRNLNANGHLHVNANGHPNLNSHPHVDFNRHPVHNANGHPHHNRYPYVNANGHPHTDADIYSNANAYTNAQAGQRHLLLNRDPVHLGFLRRWNLLWLALVPSRAGLY